MEIEVYHRADPNEKKAWIETMKVNHKAVHFNLNKNMRNCHQIIHLAKTFREDYIHKSLYLFLLKIMLWVTIIFTITKFMTLVLVY